MTRSNTTEDSLYFANDKNLNKTANSFLYLAVSAVISLFIAAIIIVTNQETTGDSIIETIQGSDSGSENVGIEDREIFEGFKTSFLPPKEVMIARKFSGRYQNVEELSSFDKNYDVQSVDDLRFKRMTQFMLASEDYDPEQKDREENGEDDDDYDLYETDIENYDDQSEPDDSKNDYLTPLEPKKSPNFPEVYHLDKGPLDDVVEQVRGQPELEEAEIGSVAVLYKTPKSASTFHAFWKGQGDKRTIRKTQADIMKKYMDPRVNPCEDFYQYACGNWAELNPIPADKAGYDTFEMLRENLDSVLRDILEFRHADLENKYPGAHLDNEFSKADTMNRNNNGETLLMSDLKTVLVPDTASDKDNVEIIDRIRRYLDEKLKSKTNIKTTIRNQTHFVAKKPVAISKRKTQKLLVQRTLRPKSKLKSIKRFGTNKNQFKRRKILSFIKDKYHKMKRDTKKLEQHYYMGKQIDPAQGSAELKARYLFQSCMNHEILQKRGKQPLLDLLEELGGWPILDRSWRNTKFNWLDLMAKLRLFNNDILISEWVGPDIKNSNEFVIQFDQTTLGLPTRDYFLLDNNKIYLNGYKNYLIKIAVLLGGEPFHVINNAEDLINFEKRLAKITSSPEERRNVSDIYRRMPLRDLEFIIPELKWKKYLTIVMNRKVDDNETVVIFALNYVKHLVKLIEETPPNTLCNYLLWRFVRHRINNLDDTFQSAKQQFYHILFGREQAPPRWKNCIAQVNSNMGMALGSMFVKKYFDEMSKNDTLTMTKELQQSFVELLHLTDWIDDETKILAERKVDSMILRIGYPDYILNETELNQRYQEVLIHPNMYFENILNILQHLTKLEQARIGQPVDKSLWNSAPAVVNAYYSRNKNQIMFPAGILQPPFYHRHFPRSLNYGGIGVVIGHEITHGFDDKGRLFDSEGNLHRWWSDSAITSFHKRAQCLIDQYGKYVVPEVNLKLDGVNTQGENIADNGGVKQAFRAYLNWLHKHGDRGETLPGLNHTNRQLFFLNFAQVWCGAMRPEAMRSKLKTAVHSPGRFRVIGTLSNSWDFAREFDCPLGSPMNPKEKCSVW